VSKADRKSKKKRGGFVIGALIGGVVALLAAP